MDSQTKDYIRKRKVILIDGRKKESYFLFV